jgi:hypothetical protein
VTGPGGMLKALTKTVIETALDEEMTDHLGYDKHEVAGRGGNSRNGARTKTVLTDDVGPMQIEVANVLALQGLRSRQPGSSASRSAQVGHSGNES